MDTWIAFAEEKDDTAKKITYVLGGWGNAGCGVHWMPKGQKGNHDWHRTMNHEYGWKGKIHKGPETE